MGNIDYSGVMLAVGILAFLVVLFIGRALVMWWLGINELLAKQDKIIELLEKHIDAQGMQLETIQRTNSILQRTSSADRPPTVSPTR